MEHSGSIEGSISDTMNEQFKILVENAITPMFVIQHDRFVYVNPPFKLITGYTTEELYEMQSSWEIIKPEYQHWVQEIPLKHKNGKAPYPSQVFQIINREGETRWIKINGSMVYYAGEPAILGSAIDVTERKRSEEALNQSEEKYRNLIDNSHDIIYTLNSEGIFTFVSTSWTMLLGHPVNQVIGKPFRPFVHPADVAICESFLQETIATGNRQSDVVYRVLHIDGSWRWHSTNAMPLWDGKGKIVGFQGNARDITECKQYNEALKQSEEKYHSLFENISEGIFQSTPQGTLISFNPAIKEMFGYSASEETINIINDIQQLYVNPEDRSSLLEILKDHDHYDFETEMHHKTKGIIWVLFNVRTVRDRHGKIMHLDGLCRDITARKLAEKEREESKQQMQQIIEHLPDATFVIDQQGKVVFWNKAMEEMTAVSKEQIIGRDDYEYTIPFYGERCPSLIDRVLMHQKEDGEIDEKYDFIKREGNTLFGEIYIPTANFGRGAYLWGAASDLIDLDGHITGAIESVRDITDRKEMEKAKAEEAAILRMTLLSIGDGVISTDREGNIQLFNRIAEKLTGWTKEEAFGKPLEEVFNIYNELTKKICINPVREVLETGEIIEIANHTMLISQDGIERPIEDSAAPIKDEDGRINGVVLVFRDITEKRERQQKITYLSYHDYLTGLYNRRFFEDELTRLDTEQNLPITLVMGDINGLKLTNDAFGHSVGDELLIKVAEVMKKARRADDIIARIGGDEFMFLLTKTDAAQAKIMVKRINESLAQEKISSIIPSVSFGWATKYTASEMISNISKHAEDNMYRYKLSESASMRNRTIKVIINTLYEKNKREEQHSQRVSELCTAIGIALNISAEDLGELRTAGLMHDIGKIALDETILNKSGKLSDSEWFEIKRHPETGYRILSSVQEFSHLAKYVISHHERWDGKGYPKGLKGSEIPLQARIMAIADAFDAMTCDRPYRKALHEDIVVAEIKSNAGKQFDPLIARLFLEQVLGNQWE